MAKKKAPVKKAPPAKKQVARRVTIPAGKSFITFTPGKPLDAEVVSLLIGQKVLPPVWPELYNVEAEPTMSADELRDFALNKLSQMPEYDQNLVLSETLKSIREARERMFNFREEQLLNSKKAYHKSVDHLASIKNLQSGEGVVYFKRPVSHE